jgi:hypothetical protein
MSIKTAFTTAWKDLKSVLSKADAWLTKEEPAIQKAVTTGSAIIEAAVPASTSIVTSFDNIEESLMGEIAAAVHATSGAANASSAPVAVTFSAEASAAIKSIVATLSTHPAVVAATSTTAS